MLGGVLCIRRKGGTTTMASTLGEPKTVRSSVSDMIARLETFISRMERRYECTSQLMLDDVRAGRARETAEVSRWLGEYDALLRLQARGRAAGSATSNTE